MEKDIASVISNSNDSTALVTIMVLAVIVRIIVIINIKKD